MSCDHALTPQLKQKKKLHFTCCTRLPLVLRCRTCVAELCFLNVHYVAIATENAFVIRKVYCCVRFIHTLNCGVCSMLPHIMQYYVLCAVVYQPTHTHTLSLRHTSSTCIMHVHSAHFVPLIALGCAFPSRSQAPLFERVHICTIYCSVREVI